MTSIEKSPLEKLADEVEELRLNAIIFDRGDEFEHLPPFAAAYFLQAMALLDQAKQVLTIAHYNEMRGE